MLRDQLAALEYHECRDAADAVLRCSPGALIDIEVRDVKHLTDIIAALRATPVIYSVARARG